MVIGAKMDKVIPWNEIQEIKNSVPKAKVLELQNSMHGLDDDWEVVVENTKKWFSNWLR